MDYDCPNCGEPIDESAASCPNCGSDDETGWNPDVDYYSVELPEDDYGDDGHAAPPPNRRHAADWQGRMVLLLAVATLSWAGYQAYSWSTALPLLFLGGCFLFYTVGTKKVAG